MDMIERVARAIDPDAWESADARLVRLGARNKEERIEDAADVMARPRIVKSLRYARAAVAAMREPTPGMQRAVCAGPPGWPLVTLGVWQAMIDQILERGG